MTIRPTLLATTLLAPLAGPMALPGPAHAQTEDTATDATEETDRAAREALVRRFCKPFSGGSVDVIDEVLTEGWSGTPAPPDLALGREAYKENVAGLVAMAPDLRIEVEEVLVEGDVAAVRSRLSATHDQPMFGVPPTGRRFEIMTMDMHRLEGERIAETWHVEDWLSAFQQIGAMGGEERAEAPEEVDLYGPLFATVERNEDGRVSQREINAFQSNLFLTMDHDGNEAISRDEFVAVDFGESYEAGKLGREAEVRAALEAFFARSDRDGDGALTFDEHRRVLFEDWRRADTFGDGVLSLEEFTADLPIIRELTEILSEE